MQDGRSGRTSIHEHVDHAERPGPALQPFPSTITPPFRSSGAGGIDGDDGAVNLTVTPLLGFGAVHSPVFSLLVIGHCSFRAKQPTFSTHARAPHDGATVRRLRSVATQ